MYLKPEYVDLIAEHIVENVHSSYCCPFFISDCLVPDEGENPNDMCRRCVHEFFKKRDITIIELRRIKVIRREV